MKRLALAACLALAARASAQDAGALLPARVEVRLSTDGSAEGSGDGEPRFSVRGRDCSVAEFLTAMGKTGVYVIKADPAADTALVSTLVTIDLHDRRADSIIELVAAAADVDVERVANAFQISGRPAANGPRPLLHKSAEQFYRLALLHNGDELTTSRALRGLAEVQRLAGDYASAYAAYEQLISQHGQSPAAKDAELLLADCYVALGDDARANQLLRAYLNKCFDSKVCEQALRRLLSLLLAKERFDDILSLREAFARLDELEPATVEKLAEAATVLVERDRPKDAVRLINPLWAARPRQCAVLGPVLALAVFRQGDKDDAAKILMRCADELDPGCDSAPALLAFAELARAAGHAPASVLFAKRAVTHSDAHPVTRLRAHLLLSDVFGSLGVADRARYHMRAAEELSAPDEASALALRAADTALVEKEPEHARLLFQAAADYESAGVDATLGVAKSLLADDLPERAIDVLRKLWSQEISDADRDRALLLAVDCLDHQKEFDQARRLLAGDCAILEGKP